MIKFFKERRNLRCYRKWRERQIELNRKMTEGIAKDILFKAAEDFRMVKNGIIVFDSEDDSVYHNDRAIFDIRTRGDRCVDLFFEEKRESLTRNEKKLLKAMKDSKYSLFVVERAKCARGLFLIDAFSKERLFLSDINMSHTISPGCLLSMRVICLDGINFSTGAGCVFENKHLKQLMNNFTELYERKKHEMTWDEMMCKYNPYFFKMMKRFNKEIRFAYI